MASTGIRISSTLFRLPDLKRLSRGKPLSLMLIIFVVASESLAHR
jgi:hypothetical protein